MREDRQREREKDKTREKNAQVPNALMKISKNPFEVGVCRCDSIINRDIIHINFSAQEIGEISQTYRLPPTDMSANDSEFLYFCNLSIVCVSDMESGRVVLHLALTPAFLPCIEVPEPRPGNFLRLGQFRLIPPFRYGRRNGYPIIRIWQKDRSRWI